MIPCIYDYLYHRGLAQVYAESCLWLTEFCYFIYCYGALVLIVEPNVKHHPWGKKSYEKNNGVLGCVVVVVLGLFFCVWLGFCFSLFSPPFWSPNLIVCRTPVKLKQLVAWGPGPTIRSPEPPVSPVSCVSRFGGTLLRCEAQIAGPGPKLRHDRCGSRCVPRRAEEGKGTVWQQNYAGLRLVLRLRHLQLPTFLLYTGKASGISQTFIFLVSLEFLITKYRATVKKRLYYDFLPFEKGLLWVPSNIRNEFQRKLNKSIQEATGCFNGIM